MESKNYTLSKINGQYVKFYVTTNGLLPEFLKDTGSVVIEHSIGENMNYMWLGGEHIASGYGLKSLDERNNSSYLANSYNVIIKSLNSSIDNAYNTAVDVYKDITGHELPKYLGNKDADASYTYIIDDIVNYSGPTKVYLNKLSEYYIPAEYTKETISNVHATLKYRVKNQTNEYSIEESMESDTDNIITIPYGVEITALNLYCTVKPNDTSSIIKFTMSNIYHSNSATDNIFSEITAAESSQFNANSSTDAYYQYLKSISESKNFINLANYVEYADNIYYIFSHNYNASPVSMDINAKVKLFDSTYVIGVTPESKYKKYPNEESSKVKSIYNIIKEHQDVLPSIYADVVYTSFSLGLSFNNLSYGKINAGAVIGSTDYYDGNYSNKPEIKPSYSFIKDGTVEYYIKSNKFNCFVFGIPSSYKIVAASFYNSVDNGYTEEDVSDNWTGYIRCCDIVKLYKIPYSTTSIPYSENDSLTYCIYSINDMQSMNVRTGKLVVKVVKTTKYNEYAANLPMLIHDSTIDISNKCMFIPSNESFDSNHWCNFTGYKNINTTSISNYITDISN